MFNNDRSLMINDIQLEDISKLESNEILTESIRAWRSDCQSGQFKIGATNMRGGKIDMELVGAQIAEGEFFGYPSQKWLGILFIDPEGVLSSILFKTESMDNFEELRRAHRLNGQSLLGKTIRATMSKRASWESGNSYYAVEFEVANEGKYAEAIAAFRQQMLAPLQLFKPKLLDADNRVINPA